MNTKQIKKLKNENKRLKKELKRAKTYEKRLNIFEKTALEPMIIFDEDHKCSGLTTSFLDVFGYDNEEEVLGLPGINLISHDYREMVQNFVKTKSETPYTADLLRKDGSTFPGIVHVAHLEYAGKKVRVASYRDISEIINKQRQLELVNAELNTIFNHSPFALVFSDGNRKIRRINKHFRKMFKIKPAEEIVGFSREDFAVFGVETEFFDNIYNQKLEKTGFHQEVTQFRRTDGKWIWIKLVAKTIDDNIPPDMTQGVVWMGDDITALKTNQQALEDKNEALEIFFNNSMVGVLILRGGRIIYRVNQRLLDILQYDTAEELEGKSTEMLHTCRDSYQQFGDNFYETLAHKEVLQKEYKLKRKDGSHVWVSISGKAINNKNNPDFFKGVVWIFDDISDRKESERLLTELATIDSLTGLANRRQLFKIAKHEVANHNRYPRPLSVMMLDIDHFKSINDNYGHSVGDKALTIFADLCLAELRDVDTMGRIGGEEFAVILPNTLLEPAKIIAERIREQIEKKTAQHDCKSPAMTVSIGITSLNDGDDVESILHRADLALYEAKANGRNRTEVNLYKNIK